jgi:hypothetical protein
MDPLHAFRSLLDLDQGRLADRARIDFQDREY